MPPGMTFVRRDASIRLYGFQTWDSLLPWDPLARDLPERVAPLLDRGFLEEWAHGRPEPDAVVVIPEAEEPGNRDGRKGSRTREDPERRLRATKARAEAAQEQLAAAEAELRAIEQRRQGLELWARNAEDELEVLEGRVSVAAADARAQEEQLARLKAELEEARRAVLLADTDARGARRGIQAVGGSMRVAQAMKRLRRTEERYRAQEEVTGAARRREQELREEIAAKGSALERALEKAGRASQDEIAIRKRVSDARRRAARATLTLSNLTRELEERASSQAEAEVPEPPASLPVRPEDAERLLREAKAALAAAEAEMRAAGQLVRAAQQEQEPAQRAMLEAEDAVRAADAEVAALEEALRRALEDVRSHRPAAEDAAAEARGAGPLERPGSLLRLGAKAVHVRGAGRRVRRYASMLEAARREAAALHERAAEAAKGAEVAREKLHQVRRIEVEARRALASAQRRYAEAVGTSTRLRMLHPEHGDPEAPVFRYVVLCREQRILGTLSFEEWAKRASGHGRAPRFILEIEGEAIWLFDGDWIVADPALSLDDLSAVIGPGAGEGGRPGPQGGLNPEVIQFVWERDAGRCVRCGSVANLEVDRIVPVYLGGADTVANLQLLCRNCVRDKSHQL